MVIGDYQVCGTAANIDRGNGYAFTIGAVRPANGIEKFFRMTGKILINLGIEIHQLSAGSFIPFNPDFGQRDLDIALTVFLLLVLIRIVLSVVPAQ
ncbi:hypothetical protein D3C73_1290750 [compost metagenome]